MPTESEDDIWLGSFLLLRDCSRSAEPWIEVHGRVYPVGPTIWMALAIVASLWLLGIAMKSLPVSTAYSVWVGVGAVGTAVLGIVLLGEPANPARLISVALIIVGIISLNATGE
jgi:multidrug transporter EmrE-like cation transporter